jgi:hypothetical protein
MTVRVRFTKFSFRLGKRGTRFLPRRIQLVYRLRKSKGLFLPRTVERLCRIWTPD